MTSTLRNLQLALFEMLKEIDCICKENDIKYSLACGTALGAIRHQGFIPWDDDLDIMFLRSEYEKFLKVAPETLQKHGYTLQHEFSESWPMHYSKLRKDNTAYIEDFEPKIKGLHQGIFVDLFPIDNLSDNRLFAELQWFCFHLLVSKEMRKRGYKTNSGIKKIAMFFSPLFPEQSLRKIVMFQHHHDTQKLHCFLGGAVVKSHNIFPRSVFDNYINVKFEEGEFPIVNDYESYLRICFNDYMKLPTLTERKERVHALLVDLDNSYEKYQVKIEES